ncbi:vesicular integral-membrane protein VIP36-like [Hydractinia symbiolongicarpus]|uniref:vesicular integral-membrane protein VIP36-like n=1 Tax=Hydractinia symbiolongicarpus TaxID=13093 RepID=UPI00254BD6B9|nr:vesicular integral-membrane protein VIP36-like [Hydractinia symbiolongicarpus]
MAPTASWHVFFILHVFIFFFLYCTVISNETDEGADSEPAGYMRREFSVIKPFVGGSSMQFWEIIGHTLVSDDHIRLTADEQSRSGAIWNIMPCFTRDWEIHLHFKVHGHSARLFGDGFGFWYTKDRSEQGPVFGGKDYFTGLALFFDTYANQNGEHAHEHPYISAQINNGTTHYDHDRDGTHSELAGCTSHFRGTDAETHVAIRYLGTKKRLTIQYDIEDENKWVECLDKYGVELPTGYYFGLSAQTGDLSDNHDIISMKFYELDAEEEGGDGEDYSKIVPRAQDAEGEREHTEDLPTTTRKQRAFNWFMVILIIIAIGGLIGFFYYQKHQKDSMKRFY